MKLRRNDIVKIISKKHELRGGCIHVLQYANTINRYVCLGNNDYTFYFDIRRPKKLKYQKEYSIIFNKINIL